MTRTDLIAVFSIVFLGGALLLPARARSQEKSDARVACSNHLKQIALAAIQYADDKRHFPHLGKATDLDDDGKTKPAGSDVPGRCVRSFIYFNYLDNPECFVCPSASADKAFPLSAEAKRDPRVFGWGGKDAADPKLAPIPHPAALDKDADKLTDLSYGWTVRGLNANSMGDFLTTGDRARVLEKKDGAQTIQGNHKDGWNVVHLDAHIEWVEASSARAKTLTATKEKDDGYLVIWDESNAHVK